MSKLTNTKPTMTFFVLVVVHIKFACIGVQVDSQDLRPRMQAE